MVCTGAYDEEDAAARAYDLAALKYWGRDTILNFPVNFLGIQTNTNTNLIRKFHMIFVCFTISSIFLDKHNLSYLSVFIERIQRKKKNMFTSNYI